MHPPYPPGASCPPETTAPPPAPDGRRLLPRPEERLASTNILLLLALPLLGWIGHLYLAAGTYDLYLPSDRPLTARVFLDLGSGYPEDEAPVTRLPASPDHPPLTRVVLPTGRLVGVRLRFDPAPGAAVRLGRAVIRARDHDDPPVAFLSVDGRDPVNRLLPLASEGETTVELTREETDPAAPPGSARSIPLPFDARGFASDLGPALLAYAAVAFGTLLTWRHLLRSTPFRRRAARGRAALDRLYLRAGRAIRAHPRAALWLAAAAGVLVSGYPVVFFGRSFVSPNISGWALYDQMPTLPGYTDTHFEDGQGSDLGASLMQSIPYGFIERRALLHDGEFPLWNRYNGAAGPLLGQGQSMIGDPLQLLVLLLGANSGAWDLKFLLARLLFAAGVGWCVRAATGRLAAALLLAFSACFLGFFLYRFDHPAYFSLCYAPWILYAWLGIAGERGGHGEARRLVRWTGLWLLANWMEFSSGTVKEASMLIAGLNATGLLLFACADTRPTLRAKARTLAGLAWAGFCFVLVSAPLWRTLLDAIVTSWSDYLTPRAWQIQPGLLLGLFDDIFYRQFNTDEKMLDPAANFVVLLGVAWAAASCKALARRRHFPALVLGALPPAALVFGVVPPEWVRAVPFLGNITHVDNTFSCVLIVHLLVLAGFGLERCRERLLARDWGLDLALALGLVGGLLAAFLGLTQAGQRSNLDPLGAIGEVPLSGFFKPYVFSLLAALVALPLLLRRFRRDRGAGAPGVAPWLALCLGAMLWRGGQQLHAVVGCDRYVIHPPVRVDLLAPSPAVAFLQARAREEPGRCLGLGDNLVAGFMGVYGLEAASGPDALQNRYYHALLADTHLPMMWHWRLVANRSLATAARRFYDLLNVRYYADARRGPAPAPIPGLRTVGRYDLDLYRSDTVWPRAFFTDALAVADGSKALFGLLAAGDGRPFAAVPPAVLAGPEGGPLRALLREDGGGETRAVVPASGYRLGNHRTDFRVHATGPGVATLLEGYQDPRNVRVEVNGRSATAFRVDEAFAGVFLPAAGDYEVSFRYGPRDLPLLLAASALGLGLLAGTAFLARRHGERRDGLLPPRG